MTVRKIIEIDEEKCDGCGQCVPACDEGALRIVDGKARLVSDIYCDGLGDCLGTCPRDAIRMVERQAKEYDHEAVLRRHREQSGESEPQAPKAPSGCPGAAMMSFEPDEQPSARSAGEPPESALAQWPVQLHLVPPHAPFLDGADLLLAADCVPFAYADFHRDLLAGRKLLVGCPKLDDAAAYVEKIAAVLEQNDIRSLAIAHMEVPCCHGLRAIAERAIQQAESDVPVEEIVIGVKGEVLEHRALPTAEPAP